MSPARLLLKAGNFYLVQGKRWQPLIETDGTLLMSFILNGELTEEDVMEIMWPDPDRMPDWWAGSMKVKFHRINSILEPFGWRIKARYNWGWSLKESPAAKERLVA